MSRLRRFLSPQLAELIVSSGDDSFLESHRREITVVFGDLRGFTAFAETVEPEEVMAVLNEYHAALGDLVHRFEGTLERFAGDGLHGVLQRPDGLPDAPARAVRMAVAMRGRVTELAERWSRMGLRARLRRGHRAGLRDPRADRLRGALRLRRDRHGDQPRRASVAQAEPRQILISQRVCR